MLNISRWAGYMYGKWTSTYARAGPLELPLFYWDPSIASSGLAFYEGHLFPALEGDLFVGALAGSAVVRLGIQGDRIVHQERFLKNQFGRIRDVSSAPDGALWLLTYDSDGKILHLTPYTRK